MDKTAQGFTLVIIRSEVENPDLFTLGEYHYHVIATNITNKTDTEIMQWYSMRGEDSENRIKELKCGFAMEYIAFCFCLHRYSSYISVDYVSFEFQEYGYIIIRPRL